MADGGGLRSRLELQLDELDLLESVFSGEGEFEVGDAGVRERASAYARGLVPATPGRLGCTLHIPVERSAQHRVEASVHVTVKLSHRCVAAELPHDMTSASI